MNTNKSPVYSSASVSNSYYLIDHPALGIPHHPLQYRALGIIKGRYTPLAKTLTKGTLTTTENRDFEAVLLAKAISSIKNHIDLEQEHNWVVYPHTIPNTNNIHFQVAGVFLHSNDNLPSLPPNYFSIRGNIIYSSKAREKVILQVFENKSLKRRRARSFKVDLKGKIPDNNIKHFFSISACLEGQNLVVKQYKDLGFVVARL